ncbi:hypothetical protein YASMINEVIRUS_647 [Yasminevirus sp. GU-2018]|uniref:Endonuclease I n=1 Tax=Yasminevirus sp. GU-2018 TaxID=2420051 RepID=A0A5K0U9M0_9VIRU|nr:hypothetical protein YASMINEVIRUS_647 [Yasminevirus sp. GU-2018]
MNRDKIVQEKAGALLRSLMKDGVFVNNDTLLDTLYSFTADEHKTKRYEKSRVLVTSDIGSESLYFDENKIITTDEDKNGTKIYNVEHVVPQSFFGGREPMKGDMHHLYPADIEVNGLRGNLKFNELEGVESNAKNIRGKKIDYEKSDTSFEPPEVSKGNIARAVAYFYVRYPSYRTNLLTKVLSPHLMILWNRYDPVDSSEALRNKNIFGYQNNLNPFILFPKLIDVVFSRLITSDIHVDIDSNMYHISLTDLANDVKKFSSEVSEKVDTSIESLLYNSTILNTPERTPDNKPDNNSNNQTDAPTKPIVDTSTNTPVTPVSDGLSTEQTLADLKKKLSARKAVLSALKRKIVTIRRKKMLLKYKSDINKIVAEIATMESQIKSLESQK